MKAIIWSKTTCPFCDKAKHLMDSIDIEYEERVLGEDWTADQLFEQCDSEGIPRPRSAPQIWLNGNYIGGYSDLELHIEQTRTNSTEGKL